TSNDSAFLLPDKHIRAEQHVSRLSLAHTAVLPSLALHCKQATSQQSCCRLFKPMGMMLYQTIKSDVRQKICIAQLRRFPHKKL
ncbi:MAG: hypothetical protein RSC60_05375, partial [Christensenellaceae bacterium]